MRDRGFIALALLALAAAPFAGCGGDSEAPPGSPENPVVATHPQEASASGHDNEGAASAQREAAAGGSAAGDAEPGFEQIVDRQSKRPQRRFSPCNLVTRAEAASILRAAIDTPFEAPQGPTCIYKGRKGSPFVTVAVQRIDFARVERQLRRSRRLTIAGRTGYCGSYGRETLYVPLGRERVLSISSRCDQAAKFAERAIPRLPA